jgi:hypothetical protein
MRQIMAKPEPILSIGGSEFTLDLLPRLKCARLRNVDDFMFPVSVRTAVRLVAHRLSRYSGAVERIIPDIRWVRRVPHRPPSSASVQASARAPRKDEELPKIAPYVLTLGLEKSSLDWLTRAPSLLRDFMPPSLLCSSEPVGVSISQLQMRPFGCTAPIVHLHAARFEVIDWLVSETVHHLIARGAGAVSCRASCPNTVSALSTLWFVGRSPSPVCWWPSNKLPLPGLIQLTSLRSDDALRCKDGGYRSTFLRPRNRPLDNCET